MDPATTSLLVLAGTVLLFLWNRLPVGVVAVVTALSLYLTGVLDAQQVLAGFGDPVVIFVASLFVVSEALDANGVTAWAGQVLTARAGSGPRTLTVTLMVLVGVFSAVVSPNGAVAALLPMAVVMAVRGGRSPAQLAMPLAFAAHAGSLLALSGSPVNVIVADAAAEAGHGAFGFFEYALVGVPLLVVTILLTTVLGPRLLPTATPSTALADLSRHARTLAGHYALQDGFYRLRVRPGSDLVDLPLPLDPARVAGVRLVAVQRADGAVAEAGQVIRPGDTLVVVAPATEVSALADAELLEVGFRPVTPDGLLTRETGVVEVVVPPRSPLVRERVFPGMVRKSEIVILAVRHLGQDCGQRPTVLEEGDSLLLHGPWPTIDALVESRDVLVVDAPGLVRRQAVPLGRHAKETLVIVGVMVVLLAGGFLPPAIAGLGAAAALVGFGAVSPPQAYRAVSWQTVVLLGGLIPLSTAISGSGAADIVAGAILGAIGERTPYLLLLAIFLLTALLGQVVSNTATSLIVVPIAVAAAFDAGVSVAPVLMTVAVAGAASFLTPIATPANMMVMGPGGYRFGDYWRLGLVMLLAWLGVALLLIPLFWPF